MGLTRNKKVKKTTTKRARRTGARSVGTGTGAGARAGTGARSAIAGLARYVIPVFLEMINTIKVYHWKTSSYATHKATDQLFADLNTKTDEFVEVLLGKSDINRDKVLVFPVIKVESFVNNADCRKRVEDYKTFLLTLPANKNFNAMANVDLLAIRDEIVALLNQFLYLLTLH
jgi:hypothetical protein